MHKSMIFGCFMLLTAGCSFVDQDETAYLEFIGHGHTQNDNDQNSGSQNSGSQNSDNQNSGSQNSDNQNSDNQNSGSQNSDNQNSDNQNSGNQNSGNQNSDNQNSDNQNSDNENGHSQPSGVPGGKEYEPNQVVYENVCRRILSCKASYKFQETCVDRYLEYAKSIAQCVPELESYYSCISDYSCQAYGSCKDYVYTYNEAIYKSCLENNHYNTGSYDGCLNYLCTEMDCDSKRLQYENCVSEKYKKTPLLHDEIVESEIDEDIVERNCDYKTFYNDEQTLACYDKLMAYSELYKLCLMDMEGYYDCAWRVASHYQYYPGSKLISSKNTNTIYRIEGYCSLIIYDSDYKNIDECVQTELEAVKPDHYYCEEEQERYLSCMSDYYDVLPELISYRSH